MTGAERVECSAVSDAAGEPLTGTASRYRLWLMLEQPGSWGHDALVDSGLPPAVGAALRDRGREAGVRVLLVKQRTRVGGPRRCFLAYTGSRQRRVRVLDVEDPADLLDLDLVELAARRFAAVGRAVEGPLFLVCTHGKHDPCCARHGAPLFRAMAARIDDVWECTHIGGDRFAGNLVCFPHGVYYGRVAAAEGARLATEYARGRLVLDYLRGRSAFSPPVQAAEVELRRRTGRVGVDDLELVSHRARGARHHVVFRDPAAGVYEVMVEVGRGRPRQLTCKATHPHAPRTFSVGDDARGADQREGGASRG